MRRVSLVLCFVLVFSLVMIRATQPEVTYNITDLGTLNGASGYSLAYGLNSFGQVVGESTHAFLYQSGVMSDLGTLGGDTSGATALNDSGQIVGFSMHTPNAGGNHAFLHQNGVMIDLGTLGGGASEAWNINAAGQIVGMSLIAGNLVIYHAFLYENNAMTDLGTLGGEFTLAYDINDSGQIAGESSLVSGAHRAFRYENGVMTDLGTLGGWSSVGSAINRSGLVVGYANDTGNRVRAFSHENNIMTDLGTLGGTYSYGYGVNNLGDIVGEAAVAGDVESHAFLFKGGVMTDLNTLLPAGSGWTLSYAWDINDAGQISGVGLIGDHWHGFLLTPSSLNTLPGSNVISQPVDSTTGVSPVTITFGTVTEGGATSLTTTSIGPPPPAGFKIGQPPTYYNLETTAMFSGSATLCINYSGIGFGNESQLKLFHVEGNQWVDRTSSLDTANDIICATVTSLSPFAIFEHAYDFTGFFQPVDNSPTLNSVKAGSAVPTKFSLNGNLGLGIFEAGYPKSQVIVCDTAAPVASIEETVTAAASSLSYDASADRYNYVWKTDKLWSATCRQLIVKLSDGSSHVANFRFTK